LGLYVPWRGTGGAAGAFESRLCEGILAVLAGTGYELILQPYAAGEFRTIYEGLRAAPHRRVRGAIVAGAAESDLTFLDAQADGPVPFVVVNRRLACARRAVLGDIERAARQAVRRLVACGVRTLTAVGRHGGGGAGDYVNDRVMAGVAAGARQVALAGQFGTGRGATPGLPEGGTTNSVRREVCSPAFTRSDVRRAGTPLRRQAGSSNPEPRTPNTEHSNGAVAWLTPVTVPHSIEGGRTAARLLWPARSRARRGLPLGIVCAFDLIAIGMEQELLERGARIPRDVCLISMENLVGVEYLPVPLTAFEQPAAEMGRHAAAALLGELRTGRVPASESLPYRLVERQSG
jgi:DNA-binding LacI/PurR family transcriptional regulator